MQHEIHVTEDFKPKRIKAYRVPENLKPEVRKQIKEMLDMDIIQPSKSEMSSPIVCVLKGKQGQDGVRIAVDYRYVNKHCEGDAYSLPNIEDVIQRVGKANWISSQLNLNTIGLLHSCGTKAYMNSNALLWVRRAVGAHLYVLLNKFCNRSKNLQISMLTTFRFSQINGDHT